MKKGLSEQEWVYQKFNSNSKFLPTVLGTSGTWAIQGQKCIILVSLTIPDIMVMRDIHKSTSNPIRTVKYKDLTYYAVNIVDKHLVEQIISDWNS